MEGSKQIFLCVKHTTRTELGMYVAKSVWELPVALKVHFSYSPHLNILTVTETPYYKLVLKEFTITDNKV